MAYPVRVDVIPALTGRNQITTLFRLILAIPHIFLVGGLGTVAASSGDSRTSAGSEGGLLGVVAWLLAIVSWFIILFTGKHPGGIAQFTKFYLRWRVRAMAYLMLLQDPYPPFGDGAYPASFEVTDPTGPRDRVSVLFRLLLVLPHLIVLVLLTFGWMLVTIVGWFVIVFTGTFPEGLHTFSTGVLRWRIRTEAYLLLLTDEYPPFSLE